MPRLMSKATVEQDTWSLALDRTREAYDLFDKVMVSFSGGKDSTIVLHAALTVAAEKDRLPVDVVFYDEEGIPYETEQYMRQIIATMPVRLTWLAVPFRCRTACDPASGDSWWPWAPEAEHQWVRPLPPEAVTSHPATDGKAPADRPSFAEAMHDPPYTNTCWLMGIRADESVTRLRSVLHRTDHNWLIPTRNGNVKAYPIYDMNTADVWHLIARHGWPYNEAYDLMEAYGVAPFRQRIAPPFGEEPLRQLHMFASLYPLMWDRLSQRVPGADAAARYFTTPVWASGDVVEKPEHLTWPEYTRWLIDQHPTAAKRVAVGKAVRRMINQHRAKTSDPILGNTQHPASGVSWQQIAATAAAGDTMSRRLVRMSATVSTPAGRTNARRRYEAEYAALTPADLQALRP
jgi:predicted phosphoadenosine phosphosulfate sulfurtransferase